MINGVYQTVRSIDATAREREALVALGTLAAGLAHEINNPASASMRAVEALRRASEYMMASLVALAERGIAADQFLQIDRIRTELQQRQESSEGALDRADREEFIGSWLEDHDVGIAWLVAPLLATSGVDRVWMEALEATVGTEALQPAVSWITSTVGMMALLSEVTESTARISHLVEDVKTYSAMDRAALQQIDLTRGIESTLTMLASKLGDIEVVRAYDDEVPEVEVFAAELNQVWTNLIVNAIDAMEGHGTLRIATQRDGADLVVEITDSGPGIDPAVLHRVFEARAPASDSTSAVGSSNDTRDRSTSTHIRARLPPGCASPSSARCRTADIAIATLPRDLWAT